MADGRRRLNWTALDGRDALNVVLVVFGVIAVLAGASNWLAVAAFALPVSAVILAKLFGRTARQKRAAANSDADLSQGAE